MSLDRSITLPGRQVGPVYEKAVEPYKPTQFEEKLCDALAVISPKLADSRERYQQARHYRRAMMKTFGYEGGMRGSRLRDQATIIDNAAPETPQIQIERIQLIWESRKMADNFGIFDHIFNFYNDYMFGDMHTIRVDTGNESDDEKIAERWANWCRMCDYTGRFNFNTTLRLIKRSQLRDGDILVHFVPQVFNINGAKREILTLQLIEADRVGSPYIFISTRAYIGGIDLEPDTGKVQAYNVYYRDPSTYAYIFQAKLRPDECLHVFKPRRVDQYRGIPLLGPAVPAWIDLREILQNERLAVKFLSTLTLFVGSPTGDATDTSLPNYAPPPGVTESNGMPPSRYTGAQPGQILYGNPGEMPTQFKSERLSPTWLGLAETLFREIFMAAKLDYDFIYNAKGQTGPAVRMSSMKTKRTIQQEWLDTKDGVVDPIYVRWFLHESGQGRMNDISRETMAKGTWQNIHFTLPAHPTVDVGREAMANIESVKERIISKRTIQEEQGLDFQQEDVQIRKEITANFEGEGADQIEARISKLTNAAPMFPMLLQLIGKIPRESIVSILVTAYGFTQEEAEKMAGPEGFKQSGPGAAKQDTPTPGENSKKVPSTGVPAKKKTSKS